MRTLQIFKKKKLLETSKSRDIKFSLIGNNNTQRSEIYCSYNIDFRPSLERNIGNVLGFNNLLHKETFHESPNHISIIKVNTVQVICNITGGAYTNNYHSHSIYEFGLNVSPGYRISECPRKIIYFPVTVKTLSHLSLTLTDQDNNNIDFRKELIVVRLHLRKCR